MKRWLVVLAACSHRDAAPCTRSVHVEMLRVDDGSEYMKQIYDRVGADKKGQPSDQDAIAAHITADIDTWNESTTHAGVLAGPQHTDYYLAGPDRAALERYIAMQPPPPRDHHLAYEHEVMGKQPTWRSYYVRNDVVIDESMFAEVRRLPQETARTGVQVILTDRGRDLLGAISERANGHKIAIVVDGAVEMAPIINGPITNGKLQILTSSLAEETRLVKGLCSLGE